MTQYLPEYDFRYNGHRAADDERAVLALKGTVGKPLMLKQPKGASEIPSEQ